MEKTKIAWCASTFNGWIGCTKVSPGCQHCYAETMMDKRYGRVKWGPDGTRKRTSEDNWKKPRAWDRKAKAQGVRQRVFCSSLADVFEDRPELVPWREDLWELIRETPNLDWLLLTKRTENIAAMLPAGGSPPNVWLGTTVENSAAARKRIPILRSIPATVHFLSMEPLLEPIPDLPLDGIEWVIVGGESGAGWRPMDLYWVREIRDRCQDEGVPFFLKQTSGFHPEELPELDGCQWMEVPSPSHS
jgi:protein gp37